MADCSFERHHWIFEGLLRVFPGVFFSSGDQNWATFHWKTISICDCGEEITSFKTNHVLSNSNRRVFVRKHKLSKTTALRKTQSKPIFLDVKTWSKIGTQKHNYILEKIKFISSNKNSFWL